MSDQNDWRAPIHPGEILADELEEIGISGAQLATRLNVTHNRVYQILQGKRSITADTALRLGRFFGTGPDIWLALQKDYELDVAQAEDSVDLDKIVPYQIAA
ncbi:MAG: HigA family addiction module antidote protein [Caldilineaceae bacterium]|nr:HigA family addiction module antidote protein [Caldilineaceae bacterium]